jgi:hypothetical protein
MQSEVLFRYDNAPDPRARELKTFPDHKHLQGGKIIETERPGLSDVLKEIDSLYSIQEE